MKAAPAAFPRSRREKAGKRGVRQTNRFRATRFCPAKRSLWERADGVSRDLAADRSSLEPYLRKNLCGWRVRRKLWRRLPRAIHAREVRHGEQRRAIGPLPRNRDHATQEVGPPGCLERRGAERASNVGLIRRLD